MANKEHVSLLKQGVATWNVWRRENPNIPPDLSGADLSGMDLSRVGLGHANLAMGQLKRTKLFAANLSFAVLSRADLTGSLLIEANLWSADLTGANLTAANLGTADLSHADLGEANLEDGFLQEASLARANLTRANLRRARLCNAQLMFANFTNADLTGCWVYGISAWDLKLEGAKQENLVITVADPIITVDSIEVAQFVYLLLKSQKIRHVIDAITANAVLILGRFTPERKRVLDALREELRRHDYLPILFDFDVPNNRDITETVSLLARMARFIVADLTDPSSIPKELEAIVPGLAVPVQPLLAGSRPYAMFKDYWKYDWVLPVYRYEGIEPLLATLAEKVIAPAEGKAKALEERRRMFEAELTKSR